MIKFLSLLLQLNELCYVKLETVYRGDTPAQ